MTTQNTDEHKKHEEEKIDEASQESFPASDAPSWTPTSVGQRPDPDCQEKINKLEHPETQKPEKAA